MEDKFGCSIERTMNVLVLEDDSAKRDRIIDCIKSVDASIRISVSSVYVEFIKALERDDYNLIVVDLVVPRFADSTASDLTDSIIEATRDSACRNFRTPVVALTGFNSAAEENFKVSTKKI